MRAQRGSRVFGKGRGHRQAGFALLEALIAVVVSVVGILGLIGLQARSFQAEAESYQRAQALVILDDIAARLASNGPNAADYVVADLGSGIVEDCGEAASLAERDLCEIGNTLRGAGETQGGAAAGAITRARACIARPLDNTYLIAVVWAGITPTGAPATTCGQSAYADQGLRRAVTTLVVIPALGA